MADFSSVTPDSPGVQNSPVLKPSTGRLPVTFAEFIKTKQTNRAGTDNDLDSILAELAAAAGPVENLTAFPDVDDYDDDAIILVNGSWFFKHDGSGIAANTFTGQHDDHYQTKDDGSQDVYSGSADNGAWPEFQGTSGFTHNPGGALSYLLAINGTGFRLGIRKSVYEAAKGSAVAAGDQVTLVISYATSPAQSETVTFTYVKEYDNHYTDTGHVPYLDFAAPVLTGGNVYRMSATPNGTHWSAIVYAGAAANTPLLTHDEDLVHWQAFTDNVTRWLRDRVNENIESVDALEAEVAGVEADVAGNESAIRVGVRNAEQFASDLVANLVFGDAGTVTEWPEDSPPAADAPQRIFVSETLTRNYTVPAANSKETSAETVAISHEPGLYELTTGGAANQIEIEVGKSAAVAGGSDVDYGATLRVFDWHQTRQFRHVPPVGKVLHSPLGSAVSGFVELTNGASHDSYAMLLENSLWQAWTVFGERTFFAHMNRTKQDGTVLHEAVELGGSDTIVTVHGVSYRVFSPFAPIPSAKQHFLRQAYEENQGDSAAAVAARKVTIYFNGAVDDTSTRFFLGNAAKGYTLVETDYGTERPVLSPTVRHLAAVSKTAFDDLATKDANTIYAVEGAGLYHGDTLLGSPSENVLLWEHTAQSSDWHTSSGPQMGAGVSTKIYEGIGGDNPWSRLEAEVKWTQTIDSVGYEHIGLLTFPGWRKGSILPARPVRLHGQGRIGGQQNTSTMNAVLKLVSRNDERTNPSHLFIEGFNTPGDTGIASATQITVRLWGVR